MRASRGSTLAEMVIATMLLAIVVVGVYAALYAAAAGTRHGGLRQQGALFARQLEEELKNYVTADTAVLAGAPGAPPWHLPGDACGGCSGGGSCWALAEGCTHDVTARLPAEYRDGYGMTLRYAVTLETVAGRTLRRARIDADWTRPE